MALVVLMSQRSNGGRREELAECARAFVRVGTTDDDCFFDPCDEDLLSILTWSGVVLTRRAQRERPSVNDIPVVVTDLADLTWLFASGPQNKGHILMHLEEAAYLYKLARQVTSGLVIEIGRAYGGSTCLLASSIGVECRLLSIDVLDRCDEWITSVMEHWQCHDRVELIVGDSEFVEAPSDPVALLLIDGDHSYDAVRRDYRFWAEHIVPGGHLIFHNAAAGRSFSEVRGGVLQLVEQIRVLDAPRFTRMATVGSLVHFVRSAHDWKQLP